MSVGFLNIFKYDDFDKYYHNKKPSPAISSREMSLSSKDTSSSMMVQWKSDSEKKLFWFEYNKI